MDVRKTQQFPYDRYEFVTSDLNPGMMFRGRELEFNAMTKYFYADRSLPKKRLTEEEMVEINRGPLADGAAFLPPAWTEHHAARMP